MSESATADAYALKVVEITTGVIRGLAPARHFKPSDLRSDLRQKRLLNRSRNLQFVPPGKQCDTVFVMAHPWWVNLLIAVPLIAYFFWRRKPVLISRGQLLASALFAASFGVVEGMVVVYLRAVLAVAAGYGASLSAVVQFSRNFNPAMQDSAVLPVSLLKVEVCREAATIIMLITVARLATLNRGAGRWAMFLWTFAIWDLTYYATLCMTIRWPSSLTDSDVLFLIPIPWISPVWFPLLVSTLSIAAVLQSRRLILHRGDDAGSWGG